ncbi:MAG: TatD family hydrolase [Bacteroidetes bacterium]|nr:TatD family hydrolase [Bacteroidota bacterium]
MVFHPVEYICANYSTLHYINIHTHSHENRPHNRTIENIMENFQSMDAARNYSAGLHPWYLKAETAEENYRMLESVAKENHVLAIGECGLDKVCETDFHLQLIYFAKQVQLANQVNKPLIIHCVRAYDEVLKTLKDEAVKVPVIFHGFNKSVDLARQLVNAGFYLSFGKHLLNENTMTTFKSVPENRYFLETDDAIVKIEDVYKAAADARSKSIESIIEQVSNNAISVFGKNIIE